MIFYFVHNNIVVVDNITSSGKLVIKIGQVVYKFLILTLTFDKF